MTSSKIKPLLFCAAESSFWQATQMRNKFLSFFPLLPPKGWSSKHFCLIANNTLRKLEWCSESFFFFFNQRADCTLTRLLNSYLLTHDTDMTWWVESLSQDKSRYCCVTDFLPPPPVPSFPVATSLITVSCFCQHNGRISSVTANCPAWILCTRAEQMCLDMK